MIDPEVVFKNSAVCRRPGPGWYCKKHNGHAGPCPTCARWWKKLEMYCRQGVWWP